MAEGFRRTTEPPVPEGYKKIGTLYQDLSELGFKSADEAEAFIADAAEGMSLEGHFIKPRTDRRITEWQVSDDLYKAITGAIEAEKNQRSEKNAPDHTEAVNQSNEKAALIKKLSEQLYRTAFPKPLPKWLEYGPMHFIERIHKDIMDQVSKATDPLVQAELLQNGINELRLQVEKYKAAFEAKQAQ